MISPNFDVVVVGAGAAGLTASIGLARAGFAVAAVEAAAFPGAENWSGCVYFGENLAHPEILGPDGIEELAWERRLVERGFFATDGHGLLGMTYRDPAAFTHCYTVLRPIYDNHLAQVARRHGVALLTETTAESLIREAGRVIGVCTHRGPLYADLVFLAEGDASHLVTREGYERFADQREAPKFLQGIKQVIEMPAGAIEEIFGVDALEGVAYEMLLRNGTLRGKSVHLNMGGFIYTNRRSLSVGLVLPADNLNEHFDGDPNLLIEWLENLPALKRWLHGGTRGVFGAKIIRGGGIRDVPTLIDEGLAIGGAASAIGIDFPYPNFTGPATAMGLLIVEAARRIREQGGHFTREELRRHYLEPLRQTHYWQDVEFLRRWPGYVKRTHVFFDRNLDLILGSAYVWTRPDRWLVTKWMNWVRLALHVGGPRHWNELRHDARHFVRALRLGEVVDRPALGRFLLDGAVNALRDLFRRPRANLSKAGTLRVHYWVAGGTVPSGLPPAPLRRWFKRAAPVLETAARRVYSNDDRPLFDKLPSTFQLLMRQVNMLDLFAAGILAFATAFTGLLLTGWDRLWNLLDRKRAFRPPRGLYRQYAHASNRAGDLTTVAAPAAAQWEARLARLAYDTARTSHIHVLWPKNLPEKNAISQEGLWHVCPAHVYETRVNSQGQPQVIVNFENCIKCETCWRTSGVVDWGRDGQQRFIYPVYSPPVDRLLAALQIGAQARPTLPRKVDCWQHAALAADQQCREHAGSVNGLSTQLFPLLATFEAKLIEFEEALGHEPRTIDQARAEYLEMLARYAQQLAQRVVELLNERTWFASTDQVQEALYQRLQELAHAVQTKAQERARRTWTQHYSWATADGRQLRYHHLAGLRRCLEALEPSVSSVSPSEILPSTWSRAEQNGTAVVLEMAKWTARLDEVFSTGAWRDLEAGIGLTSCQDAMLRDLIGAVPLIDPANLSATLHPPIRKALLAELGRRDASLAFRVASHLWARDLARLASGSSVWAASAARLVEGGEWACVAVLENVEVLDSKLTGEAWFVPAKSVQKLVILIGDQLVIAPPTASGLEIEDLHTLGLRGAGLCRIRLDALALPESRTAVDHDRMRRVWQTLSAADLTSIANGMAGLLTQRAVAHATSRVQFPGLFHDDAARDAIGKFGAVKKMIAEMGARRYLIETLDHTLSPTDFSSASVSKAGLIKALVAEALGTAPGSLSYNAGQVFGGTGYSEDDILSKYYRDAAAWRFIGQSNVEIYRRHGQALVHGGQLDSQRLASVAGEAELFDEVVQRKALQAELDEIRNARSRLKMLAVDWQTALLRPLDDLRELPSRFTSADRNGGDGKTGRIVWSATAEFSEALARQDAHLLANKALVLRTHARLEQGLSSETEIAQVRVWLNYAAASLEECEGVARRYLDPASRRDDHPVVELAAGPPVSVYADYLAAPARYDSGRFLVEPVDLLQPRLVPEMVQSDSALARVNDEIRALLLEQFGKPRDGLPYERYIERQHRPDASDLDYCRRHGFFRMPIPKDLGGEGRSKIDYYLLTTNAKRLADVGISLLIQVNTSLGTSPVFLARDKDLPQAQEQVAAFIGDSALHRELQRELQALVRAAASGRLEALAPALGRVNQRLQSVIFSRAALRALAHPVVQSWQKVMQSAELFDVGGLRTGLSEALAAWQEIPQRALEYHDEVRRRCQACDLFLRWVASGQISAFALTEPSAGSDTARVATRAILRSVAVEPAGEGVYRFTPFGGKEPGYLLNAAQLEFVSGTPAYRWSDAEEAAPVHFDEYDYETDDPRGLRYFERGGERVRFTDIAQLRERGGKLWYDYWELTGAKMWITNGRMCGIMCLYAKMDVGVTGFIVDRHALGLVVGKDEAKLGQWGSPTNELSLQAVRVPRENVIGVEGRGQVNALETLNVGRAGLATSAMAEMEGLIESSRIHAAAVHGPIPDWVQWRLDRMEENRFTAEALAYEVVGRFEHKGTKSVRLESAIAKMLASELLHQLIEWAEEIYGLPGQTQLHLVEKRKRDARILNIYEGTNEIQRFFILRDLASEIAPKWSGKSAKSPAHVGREALELEASKEALRQRVESALELFGQTIWQDPNLQANCFLLSEAAAWFKAADSTLGRLAWLTRQELVSSGQEPAGPPAGVGAQTGGVSGSLLSQDLPPARGEGAETRSLPTGNGTSVAGGGFSGALEVGRRAFARCNAEIRNRLRRFDEELTHLRRGYYAPEVRAAALLYDRTPAPAPTLKAASRITRPLNILVVLNPLNPAVPEPVAEGDRLLEAHLTLAASDRAALEAALKLRDEAVAPVHIDVLAFGPRRAALVLREAINVGVDRVRLVVCENEAVSPDCAAEAIAMVHDGGRSLDLVLGGSADAADEQGLLPRLLATALDVPYAGAVALVTVQADSADSIVRLLDSDGREHRSHMLPAVVGLEPGLGLRQFSVAGYLKGLARQVELVPWPKGAHLRPAAFAAPSALAPRAISRPVDGPLSAPEAAQQLLAELGLTGTQTAVRPYDGPLEETTHLEVVEDGGQASVVAVLAADSAGRLSPSGRAVVEAGFALATEKRSSLRIVMMAPTDEESQRRSVSQLLNFYRGSITLLSVASTNTTPELTSRLLVESWPKDGRPMVVVGEHWTESAFVALARCRRKPAMLALRVSRLSSGADGLLALETSRAGGALRIRQTIDPEAEGDSWISLVEGAEVVGSSHPLPGSVHVRRCTPRLERFYALPDVQGLLQELKRQSGVVRLSDADFIIDIGFGIGNRDGYEAVIEPLVRALRDLGVENIVVGGSRKVTEELHLLGADCQIGQSGVSVNPKILLAIGVSGAPQHLNYISPRATILAFNRDAEAPIMILNRQQPRPRVLPVVGDLFETVPAVTAALQKEYSGQTAAVPQASTAAVEPS
jgi:alkylation response protein AidB-like acyl-CoA dehydrogenase/flavin-dependent dehydrogenase/electron transfer flavoprotein alpha/beta subunit/ferredoxin-like protein FixX